MKSAVVAYISFCWQCIRISFRGTRLYFLWMTLLSVIALLGLNAYCKQFVHGLVTTGMTDQVSWGMYIANFTFLVGLAAAAVMLVIPVYVYRNMDLHDVVIFGELFAVAAIIMCIMFVTADLGRPDRFHHLLLRINFPMSMLTWDVFALNGYLLLNLHICGYLLYTAYRGRKPTKLFYIPFVFIAIFWAVSIHTVTAFLYVGLGGRPMWNSAIIGPRFLASAFAAGPAFIILTLQIVRRFTTHEVKDEALFTLRRIIQVAMIINIFLLVCELFTEFYTDSAHLASIEYLFFGLGDHKALVPWIWTAMAMNMTSVILLMLPVSQSIRFLNVACVLAIFGIWIEKGMGLIIPAFVPTPLGEIVEYAPTWNETLVCFGIWAFGILFYTMSVRVAVPILSGELTYKLVKARNGGEAVAGSAAGQ